MSRMTCRRQVAEEGIPEKTEASGGEQAAEGEAGGHSKATLGTLVWMEWEENPTPGSDSQLGRAGGPLPKTSRWSGRGETRFGLVGCERNTRKQRPSRLLSGSLVSLMALRRATTIKEAGVSLLFC